MNLIEHGIKNCLINYKFFFLFVIIYLKTCLKKGSAAFMEHDIISYLIDNDDDVHMINPEKQIHNRIRCVQYHQYQAYNWVAIHIINVGILQNISISCPFSIEDLCNINSNKNFFETVEKWIHTFSISPHPFLTL